MRNVWIAVLIVMALCGNAEAKRVIVLPEKLLDVRTGELRANQDVVVEQDKITKIVATLFSKQPPIAIPSVTLKLIWHRKNNNDEAHIWLRTAINSTCKEMINE